MRWSFGSFALVAVLFAAGCGGGGGGGSTGGGGTTQTSSLATKPPGVVVAAAAKAADSASSVHISGGGTQNGQPISLDLTFARGKGATGSISLNGASFDLVLIGNTAYIKAGAAFWKKFAGAGAGAASQLFADKWLKFSANNAQLGPLTRLANQGAFFNKLLNSHGKLENKGDTTFKGQSVVAIYDTTKKGAVLYVASTGTPYPVGLVQTGNNGGTITFDQWNQPVTLTAPKGALDFSQLTG
jgi:hypothetical protein